jgi:hypothetical protein
MENDNIVQDPVSTDTLEPESTSPAESVGGNEGTTSTSQVSGGIDPKEYENLKREKGKLKQVQEQLKQLQNVKSQYDNVSSWIAKDPERLKNALIETSGYTPEQAEQYVNQMRKQSADSSLTKTNEQPQTQYVDPLDRLADEELRREKKNLIIKRQNALKKFIEDNQTSEKPLSPIDLELVYTFAGRLESSNGLPTEQALDEAKRRLFQSDKLIESAREEGELQGLATASSIGSSIMSSPLGTQPKRPIEPNVPNNEWETAQSYGFTDKAEYVLYRDNPAVGVS